jgi:protein required for attachment to host cells
LGSEELGKQLNEKTVIGGDNKVDQDERESSRNNTPTSTVPFPSTSGSIRVSRDSSQKKEEEELGEVATPTHSQSFNCILDDGTSRPTVAANTESAGLVKDPKMLGQMSREELEKMLNEADRIIREKEQGMLRFSFLINHLAECNSYLDE